MKTLSAWITMISTLDTHSTGTNGNLILKPKKENQIDFNFNYSRLSEILHSGLKSPGLTIDLSDSEAELFKKASFAASYLFEESGRSTTGNPFIEMHNRLFKNQ